MLEVTRYMTSAATVRTLQGESAYGPTFADQVTVRCWPEQSSKQVVTAGGEETTSGTRLWCEGIHEAMFAVGSSVLFAGRESEVITASVHDPGAILMPRLLEVALR